MPLNYETEIYKMSPSYYPSLECKCILEKLFIWVNVISEEKAWEKFKRSWHEFFWYNCSLNGSNSTLKVLVHFLFSEEDTQISTKSLYWYNCHVEREQPWSKKKSTTNILTWLITRINLVPDNIAINCPGPTATVITTGMRDY